MRFTQNPNLNGIPTIYDLGITLVIYRQSRLFCGICVHIYSTFCGIFLFILVLQKFPPNNCFVLSLLTQQSITSAVLTLLQNKYISIADLLAEVWYFSGIVLQSCLINFETVLEYHQVIGGKKGNDKPSNKVLPKRKAIDR